MKRFLAQGRTKLGHSRLYRQTQTQGQCTSSNSPFLQISEEVREAVRTRKPVVALETTIYTHGFPYPDNIALASRLESIVRVNGGIPATIGVLHGVAKVGFREGELIELLASAGKPGTIKLSRRDLGYICGLGVSGRKLNGGTTIAGTMVLAHLAGIKIFATGGLGGVHKGAENSMDISADLTELGRTPVALISSGCKSFLDIPRTLEYLETQGVSVGTFADGRSENVDFPAFWTRESGVRSPTTIKNEEEAAAIIYAQMSLQLSSGLVFANPIAEEHSLSRSYMDDIMAKAVSEANKQGISGSNNTPFVLAKIRELTQGSTVEANRVLVEGNVSRGTKVALELTKMELRDPDILSRDSWTASRTSRCFSPVQSNTSCPNVMKEIVDKRRVDHACDAKRVDVLVAGSLAIDLSCDHKPVPSAGILKTAPTSHTSNPAVITQSLGGVGQNVATALHYLGTNVRLCSAVGDDVAGRTAINILRHKHMITTEIEILRNARTAQFVALNDSKKDLVIAMADMSILEGQEHDFATRWKPHIARCRPTWLVVDANWDNPTLAMWMDAGRAAGAKIAFEPVSVEKSTRFHETTWSASTSSIPFADLTTPNHMELIAMYETAKRVSKPRFQNWSRIFDRVKMPDHVEMQFMEGSPSKDKDLYMCALKLLSVVPCIITKLGPQGVLLTEILKLGDSRLSSKESKPYVLHDKGFSAEGIGGVYIRLFPPAEEVLPDHILSVNGVGDTFLGTVVAGLTKGTPKPIDELVDIAQKAAVMTLKNKESVSPAISDLRFLL